MAKKRIFLIMMVISAGMLSSCTAKKVNVIDVKPPLNAAALKGPSGIGMAPLMDDYESGNTVNDYGFSILGAPEDVVAKMINGEVDTATVPINLAATLYNKTDGEIKLAAVNTLGVLYIVEKNGRTLNSIEDLSGKTLYATGKGATPEFILKFILEQNGLDDVTVEYKSEHSELAALLAAGEADMGMLPEPFVTTVLNSNPDAVISIDLTEEWEKACEKSGYESALCMTGLVVRTEYLEANKQAFDDFLDEYEASVEFVNSNVEASAALVEKFGIMPSAAVASKAIPNCNITFIEGEKMKKLAGKVFDVLYTSEPMSVGGKLPDESFYYEK